MLPVVQRELLVSSRKWTAFQLRMLAALAAFFMIVITIGMAPMAAAQSTGKASFFLLTRLAFWAVYFGGALMTADCLAIECREGTLGLLFLTDLKGYDVVLGKLAARLLPGVYCLIAIVPVLAVPFLLGGISAGQFWCTVAILAATLFLSGSVGILISVIFKQPQGVFTASAVLLGAVASISTIGRAFFPSLSWLWWSLSTVQPLYAFNSVAGGAFALRPNAFLLPFACTCLAAVAMLALASRLITDSWQTKPPGSFSVRWENLRSRIAHGTPAQRLALRRRLLAINPILWLHSRIRLMPRIVTGFLASLAGLSILWYASGWYPWREMSAALSPLIFLQGSLIAMVAFECAIYLPTMRQNGSPELILPTRLTTQEILAGHVLTLRHLFRYPILTVITYSVIWLIFAEFKTEPQCRIFAFVSFVCLNVNLVICCYTVAWCALFYSVRAKAGNSAAMRSYGAVALLPILIYIFALPALDGLSRSNSTVKMVAYLVISAANAWFFGSAARGRLHEEFREAISTGAKREDMNPDALTTAVDLQQKEPLNWTGERVS